MPFLPTPGDGSESAYPRGAGVRSLTSTLPPQTAPLVDRYPARDVSIRQFHYIGVGIAPFW